MPGILRLIYEKKDTRLERNIFGLHFKNPVGLAAGFDKNGVWTDQLSNLGFGFIEIGTVTPKPQGGNDKPRLFRLKPDEALINRMGFNNDGSIEAANNLRKRKSKMIIGGNIGKNKLTDNDDAVIDYLKAFNDLYQVVDYFVVNVSSPNTPGLRALQDKDALYQITSTLQNYNQGQSQPKPLWLKIAPDLTPEQLNDILELAQQVPLDGLVATNTTIGRDHLSTESEKKLSAIGMGGLSGKPLRSMATEVLRYLRQQAGNSLPIISSGGIMSGEDGAERLRAGADLIQIWTGFIYRGPALIKQIGKSIHSSKHL